MKMNPNLRGLLSGLVGCIMAIWFFGGLFLFPDAPIDRCQPETHYLYSTHPYGYCGKQGQSHSAADFDRFNIWQDILLFLWPLGMGALILLNRGSLKPQC